MTEQGSPARIALCSAEPGELDDFRTLFSNAGYTVDEFPISLELLEEHPPNQRLTAMLASDLILVQGHPSRDARLIGFCRGIRDRLAGRFLPIVFAAENIGSVERAYHYEIGGDGFVTMPVDPLETMAQIRAHLRVKELQDRLVERSHALRRRNRRLELSIAQMEQELRLAGKIQRSFLPHQLPEMPGVTFAVKYVAMGSVAGDFYDVQRLDDEQVGFYVADAMGHGVPASLLTIYIKKGIQTRDASPNGEVGRLLRPDEVLERLNRDLLDQQLTGNPFITLAYLILDVPKRRLAFARAGHPYPLRIPAEGPLETLVSPGTLLGVFEAPFTALHAELQPGDRVLVYSDGIDGVKFEDHQTGTRSFFACVAKHRDKPIGEMVDSVYDELFPDRFHEDDFTLLGLELDQ